MPLFLWGFKTALHSHHLNLSVFFGMKTLPSLLKFLVTTQQTRQKNVAAINRQIRITFYNLISKFKLNKFFNIRQNLCRFSSKMRGPILL